LTVLGILFGPLLLVFFGVEETVQHLGSVYIRILFISSIPITLQFLTAAIFQAVGDASTAFWINLVSVLTNVILDPFMIFGIGPFPRMEVAGAAAATSLARAFGMVIALYVLFNKETHLRVTWEGFRLDRGLVKRMLKIGVPNSLQLTIRSMSNIIMMGIVARYGTFALAAFGIGIRIDMLVLMPGFGLGAATATLVGQNLGALKPHRAVKSGWYAVGYYMIIMVCAGILFYLFSAQIIGLFNKTPQVILNGQLYIHTMVFAYPFLAMSIPLNRALGGAGETLKTMLITAFSLFAIAVPLAHLIPYLWSVEVRGVWMAIAAAHFTQALIISSVFLRGRWKQKAI
jgi:putative MATE family efflux protein